MSSAAAHPAVEKGGGAVSARNGRSPARTIVVQAQCSNGDRFTLRLTPADAAALCLQLQRELGWLPAELPDEDDEQEGDA